MDGEELLQDIVQQIFEYQAIGKEGYKNECDRYCRGSIRDIW